MPKSPTTADFGNGCAKFAAWSLIWAGLTIAFLGPLVWLLWLILMALAMTPPLAFLLALIAGPGTILLIVKRVNRRHDPRYAKLPADPP